MTNANETKFTATIEILHGQSAAIVTLTDSAGEWSGSQRIDLPRCPAAHLRSSLYEEGYRYASLTAMAKGGRVETYREGVA